MQIVTCHGCGAVVNLQKFTEHSYFHDVLIEAQPAEDRKSIPLPKANYDLREVQDI